MRDIREKNWFWLDNALVDREDIGAMEKLVYMLLARFADKDGKCFPSQEKLCKLTGIKDYRTIVKYMESLKEKGLLEIKKTKGKPNIYFLKNVNSEVPAKNVPTLNDTTKNVPTKFADEVPTKNAGIVPTKFAGITKSIEQNPFEQDKKEKNKKEKSKNEIQEFINNLNKDDEYKKLLFKYVEYRKLIKKPIKTIVPIQKIIKDFPDWFNLDEAINIATEKEWQGLEPEWIAKYKQSKINNFGSKTSETKDTSQFLVDDNYLEQMKERYGIND